MDRGEVVLGWTIHKDNVKLECAWVSLGRGWVGYANSDMLVTWKGWTRGRRGVLRRIPMSLSNEPEGKVWSGSGDEVGGRWEGGDGGRGGGEMCRVGGGDVATGLWMKQVGGHDSAEMRRPVIKSTAHSRRGVCGCVCMWGGGGGGGGGWG